VAKQREKRGGKNASHRRTKDRGGRGKKNRQGGKKDRKEKRGWAVAKNCEGGEPMWSVSTVLENSNSESGGSLGHGGGGEGQEQLRHS